MPLVARLGSGIPLVARDRELSRLRAALAQAGEGTAGAVLLAGDAGVGKTRLIDELAASAEDTLVLMGRCLDAGETGLPYLPFAEALSPLKNDTTNRPALAMLLPQLALPAEREPGTEGMIAPSLIPGRRPEQDVGQLQLFDAVLGILGDLSERQRVLLVVEDLHWADASTRYLLSFLLSRLRSQRLLVVGTYRADDLHRSHPLRPLLSELFRLPAVDRLDLSPFNAADARRFVEALSDDLPEDVVQQVAERSEGNAFFAEELTAAATCDDRSLPSALADVLLSRVERLSPEAQHVARVASVRGRRVRHDRLREAAGVSDLQLDAALRELVQHHLLVVNDDEVYTFRHALLREAVYRDLLPGERVRLHAAYAQHLAQHLDERGAAAALAHHAFQSHDLAQALTASIKASREAERTGAPAESLQHLEKALNLWNAVPEADRPSDVDEATLLRRASWVAGTAGQPERAVAFGRSAKKALDGQSPEEAADVLLRLSQALSVLDGNDQEHHKAATRAWELVREREPSPTRARVLAGVASMYRQQRREADARKFAELAIADGQQVGAAGAVADALGTLGILDDYADRHDEARISFERAIACAREVGAVSTELRAWYYFGLMYYDSGDLAEAARVYKEAGDRAQETGLTWSMFGLEVRILQVLVHYYLGDWSYAEWASEPPGMSVSSTVLARLAAASTHLTVSRGDLAASERTITKLRSDWHRDIQIALITGGTGAELALWRGRPELAVERVTDALEWTRKLGGPWVLGDIRIGAIGVAGYVDLAAKARRKRDTEAEKQALENGHKLAEHVRLTARNGVPRTSALGPEGRAWLARANAEESRFGGPGDPDLWQQAVDGFGYGLVFEQALCRWRLAEALLGADRREEAAEQLRLADEVATRLGATPLQEAVASCAKRARITLRADEPAREQIDLFTPRERSVLGLVASGRTNREVGEELYISEKTVSVHLSRIMAKLGASRRAEAVAIAYDRGLLD